MKQHLTSDECHKFYNHESKLEVRAWSRRHRYKFVVTVGFGCVSASARLSFSMVPNYINKGSPAYAQTPTEFWCWNATRKHYINMFFICEYVIKSGVDDYDHNFQRFSAFFLKKNKVIIQFQLPSFSAYSFTMLLLWGHSSKFQFFKRKPRKHGTLLEYKTHEFRNRVWQRSPSTDAQLRN
jgi:hypothetical protein